jgi:hypothetical protein
MVAPRGSAGSPGRSAAPAATKWPTGPRPRVRASQSGRSRSQSPESTGPGAGRAMTTAAEARIGRSARTRPGSRRAAGWRMGFLTLRSAAVGDRARSARSGAAGRPRAARRAAPPMGGGRPIGAIVRPGGAGSSAGSGSGAPWSGSGIMTPRQGRSHRDPMSRRVGRSGSPFDDDTAAGRDEPRVTPTRGRDRRFSRRRRRAHEATR